MPIGHSGGVQSCVITCTRRPINARFYSVFRDNCLSLHTPTGGGRSFHHEIFGQFLSSRHLTIPTMIGVCDGSHTILVSNSIKWIILASTRQVRGLCRHTAYPLCQAAASTIHALRMNDTHVFINENEQHVLCVCRAWTLMATARQPCTFGLSLTLWFVHDTRTFLYACSTRQQRKQYEHSLDTPTALST
ncbi:unnamed protein product [Sphagnum balticum]